MSLYINYSSFCRLFEACWSHHAQVQKLKLDTESAMLEMDQVRVLRILRHKIFYDQSDEDVPL